MIARSAKIVRILKIILAYFQNLIFIRQPESLQMERELMNTSLANAREDNVEAESKNQELMHTVTDQSETIDQMQKTVDELNHQVASLRQHCDELNEALAEREMEMRRLEEENKTHSEQAKNVARETTAHTLSLNKVSSSNNQDLNR